MLKIKEIYLRWFGILVVALIVNFFIKQHEHAQMPIWQQVLISFTFTAILWNGVLFIMLRMRKRYTSIQKTPRRLIVTSVLASLLLVFGSNLIGMVLGLCSLDDLKNPAYFFRYAHVNFIVAIIVTSIYEGAYFFGKWKDSLIQNEELKSQQIRTQYGVLQNQMSPHFLFNSLNTLTTLITEDQNTAIDFTQTLSDVYRYILHNKERELVPLCEEMEFCQSYVFLLKKRFPENFEVSFNIPKTKRHLYIAPLTLQMLLENAIKHNAITKGSPLRVEVKVDENNLLEIRNNLQTKHSLEISTKTGLENIKKRYQLLGQRAINVVKTEKDFIVQVPLIELISEVEHLKSAV
ncbi:sensor histidine kinase [Reichenbachiella ulvae]|uniref:Histidine kinase n=1 Tax=Reichenbachiella ulvae TaxID=2980104 RepID=A0ABT3CX16_9BACT|nr:histidine kinase [Reichenbachiella ulvae]MCV9388242.1 histidine kinase [Reichenbachiella ulvae]